MEFELLNKKYNTEYTNQLLKHSFIFYEIYEACNREFIQDCGSYLFNGQEYKYGEETYLKQELLYRVVKNATHVLEIGTYLGHSLLIMLMSNPTVRITCIDIDHKYAGPSIKVLNKYFGNRVSFIHMDSLNALNILIRTNQKYDFFHIDGEHNNDTIENEFNFCRGLRKKDSMNIIFDDQYQMKSLQEKIEREYTILHRECPDCCWSNLYYEIN